MAPTPYIRQSPVGQLKHAFSSNCDSYMYDPLSLTFCLKNLLLFVLAFRPAVHADKTKTGEFGNQCLLFLLP
jgi:hypothetical protein